MAHNGDSMDNKQIKDLMDDFDKSDLVKIKIKKSDFSIEMEKYVAPVAGIAQQVITAAPVQQQVPAAIEEVKVDTNAIYIESPMVGTVYSAPSPTSPDFVKVGDVVSKGQTVAIVEAMKIMNEIEAEFECRIVDILVKNGQVVEYEMPLFLVEKL
jgi:acetyl-CoA carboxylase biotin carboxyl carrier protein